MQMYQPTQLIAVDMQNLMFTNLADLGINTWKKEVPKGWATDQKNNALKTVPSDADKVESNATTNPDGSQSWSYSWS